MYYTLYEYTEIWRERKLNKEKNEAEVDANSIISLSVNGIPVTNITLNLMHNGFSRRSWLNSNMKDLYKGNGRVRHEYHNIEQGCLQNKNIAYEFV